MHSQDLFYLEQYNRFRSLRLIPHLFLTLLLHFFARNLTFVVFLIAGILIGFRFVFVNILLWFTRLDLPFHVDVLGERVNAVFVTIWCNFTNLLNRLLV